MIIIQLINKLNLDVVYFLLSGHTSFIGIAEVSLEQLSAYLMNNFVVVLFKITNSLIRILSLLLNSVHLMH